MKRHLLQYLFDGGDSYFDRQEQAKSGSSSMKPASPAQNVTRHKASEQSSLQAGSPHQRSTTLRT